MEAVCVADDEAEAAAEADEEAKAAAVVVQRICHSLPTNM